MNKSVIYNIHYNWWSLHMSRRKAVTVKCFFLFCFWICIYILYMPTCHLWILIINVLMIGLAIIAKCCLSH